VWLFSMRVYTQVAIERAFIEGEVKRPSPRSGQSSELLHEDLYLAVKGEVLILVPRLVAALRSEELSVLVTRFARSSSK
jgi:hypothetical protein